jgi:hypothetical protein
LGGVYERVAATGKKQILRLAAKDDNFYQVAGKRPR